MENFVYVNAASIEQVPKLLSDEWGETKVIAGGTDLLGELKEYIETPKKVINLKSITGLDEIKEDSSGLTIGALTTIAEIAAHPTIQKHYTVLAQAASTVASPQIRNVGTLGGNLCQRPRCWYYRSEDIICLKKGGEKCYALSGLNKYHAIFGGGPVYIVHPSDTAPALVALGATVKIFGPDGEKTISLEDFFILPKASNPFRENILGTQDIVVEVHVPKPNPKANTKSVYIKVREKEAFDFALASVAGVFEMDGRTCRKASVVLGGVAPAPWRSKEAEITLSGKRITEIVARKAGKEAVKNADPMTENAYKIPLTRNIISRAAMMTVGA